MVLIITFVSGLLLVTLPDTNFTWWLLGTLQTCTVAAYFHLLHIGYLANDADAIRHVRGA